MLPPGGVDDAVGRRELPGALRENCAEALNVLASVFNTPGAPHVRLYGMHVTGEAVPGDVASLAQRTGERLDVVLTIAGYGDAHVCVVPR